MKDGKKFQRPWKLVSAWYTADQMPEVSVNIGNIYFQEVRNFTCLLSSAHKQSNWIIFTKSVRFLVSVKEMWLLRSQYTPNRWTLSIARRYLNSLGAHQESLTFSGKSSFCTDAVGGGGSNGSYIITVPFPSGWSLFRELGERISSWQE